LVQILLLVQPGHGSQGSEDLPLASSTRFEQWCDGNLLFSPSLHVRKEIAVVVVVVI
jgi:hypothetical protein